MKDYDRHYVGSALIPAKAEILFAYLDDHSRLSSHMSRSSWMMGGGRMEISMDEGGGRKVGSHIYLNGRAFGMKMSLDEVVVRSEPPRLKVWETVGDPKLVVIGRYRMAFEIRAQNELSVLRVSIDYDLPPTNVWLGRLFGGLYAGWCVRRMLKDTRDRFPAPHQHG